MKILITILLLALSGCAINSKRAWPDTTQVNDTSELEEAFIALDENETESLLLEVSEFLQLKGDTDETALINGKRIKKPTKKQKTTLKASFKLALKQIKENGYKTKKPKKTDKKVKDKQA